MWCLLNGWMKLIGATSTKDDKHAYISAEGDPYPAARRALEALIPEGQHFIAIRAER